MLHTVAKLHYEAEMSQVDIAKRLGISAATISRLLQRARAEGIVRIQVRDLVEPDKLMHELKSRLGLKAVAVVDAPGPSAVSALAAPVGEMLKQSGLRSGSVLAIGWGRAVREIVEAGLPPIAGVITVPATGGMQQQHAHFQVNEFVRLAAQRLGGTPQFIHAPYLPTEASRRALLSDPAIVGTVALWDRVDAAIVGVGLPHAQNSPDASAATPDEQALSDAVGDVIRHYFDANGKLTDWEGEQRMIAMSREQLRGAPLVIGVAVGEIKVTAIIGAARAGLISALATDIRTAEAILAAGV